MARPLILVLVVGLLSGLLVGQTAAQPPCVNINVAGIYFGATFNPGVNDLGIHCDDCTVPITFPFPVRFYGFDYTSAAVSSNGNIQFDGASTQFAAETPPTRNMSTACFPLWDDLILTAPGDGVFTSTTGTAPSRVFNIEWRAHYFNQPSTAANFEVRFFENSRTFEFVYGTYGIYAGQSYVIGVQMGVGTLGREASHGSAAYPPGTRIVFTETYTNSRGSFAGPFPTGVVDIGNHCDDCITSIAFPFPIDFYGQAYNSANVSSNGNLQFASANTDFDNACLPVPGFGPTIFAHWDDLRTDGAGEGVFTRVSGVAPFRIFDIEWRAHYFSGAGSLDFTVRFLEGLNSIEIFFQTSAQHGVSATIGNQAGDERYDEQWCNTINTANPGDIYIFSLPPMSARGYGGYVPPCTSDIGNHCDDCTTTITLPFTVSLFGEEYTSANVSSNGNIQFNSNLANFTNTCLPNPAFGTTIFGYWDDLLTNGAPGSGIYTSVFGVAPNRQLGIEWRATSIFTGAEAHFEIVLTERTPRFSVYYGALPDGGAGATAGVQHGGGPEVLTHFCNATGRTSVSISYLCLGPPCEPTITQQPASVSTCPSGAATFSVGAAAASGGSPFAYLWQWLPIGVPDWTNILDGVNTDPATGLPAFTGSGSATDTVVVTNTVGASASTQPSRREVRVVVANPCGSITSSAATWTICPADFDCSGAIGIPDIFDFLAAWFAADPRADFNGVNGIGIQDIFDFLSAWFAGCL